MKFDGS